ncbi:MAG: hypothetical protein AAF944_21020 [Bacteroidota bacterium]
MDKYTLTYLLLLSSLLFIGCSSPQEKNEGANPDESESSLEPVTQQKYGRANYAVVWKWATTDAALIKDNIVPISNELTDLWKQDIIENAYFDAEPKTNQLANLANIAFFLKAKDQAAARSVLDGLTVVTKNIATYQLYPVGQLWLDRKTETINEKGITKSYATVWTTTKSPFQEEGADQLLKKQSDVILSLWNDGIIENVYFDIEGTYSPNEVTDFVFFVNANSLAEAESICESLPFFQEDIASYQIHPAGVFWMGQYDNN